MARPPALTVMPVASSRRRELKLTRHVARENIVDCRLLTEA